MFEHKKGYTKRKKFLKSVFYNTRRHLFVPRNHSHTRKTILFYPQYPSWRSSIHKAIMYLGWNITNDPTSDFDLLFCWEDRTFRRPNAVLEKLLQYHPSLNGMCIDVSKEMVAEIFQQVFRYEIATDPLIHNGYCVKKSNFNSWHDGEVIHCPVDAKSEGVVYQKLLSNLVKRNYYQDYRVPVIFNKIPFVSPRLHNKSDRFNHVVWAGIECAEQIFSKEEISCILLFSKKIGMDYGELDIIRDDHNGHIYIVDANHTPCFPPRKIVSKEDRKKMIEANATILNIMLALI